MRKIGIEKDKIEGNKNGNTRCERISINENNWPSYYWVIVTISSCIGKWWIYSYRLILMKVIKNHLIKLLFCINDAIIKVITIHNMQC